LQRSYGNQAVILKDWGRLEESMALHKKEEALCLELSKRSSLAYCYCNWGFLAREQRDRKTEREKLATALDIFTELNMLAGTPTKCGRNWRKRWQLTAPLKIGDIIGQDRLMFSGHYT
jgi:hypothetical protein